MIKGLDNGYLYTKDNERRMYKSAYSNIDYSMADIIIDGKGFCVGAGNFSVDVDKTGLEINKVCTIYNLALTGQNEYFLVAGLPIDQYKLQKDRFKLSIMSYNESEVIYKDQQYKFRINDVLIFPQGAAALIAYGKTEGEYIVFDIGGLTLDIAYMEMINGKPVLLKKDTWYKGVQKLYGQIIHEVNNRYGLTLEPRYAEKILTNGLTIDGEKQDLSFLNPVYSGYIEPIITELQLNYPSKTTQICLCGGGASILGSTFKAKFKSVEIIPDSQFVNAIGYYKIGCRKFDKYILKTRGVRISHKI